MGNSEVREGWDTVYVKDPRQLRVLESNIVKFWWHFIVRPSTGDFCPGRVPHRGGTALTTWFKLMNCTTVIHFVQYVNVSDCIWLCLSNAFKQSEWRLCWRNKETHEGPLQCACSWRRSAEGGGHFVDPVYSPSILSA